MHTSTVTSLFMAALVTLARAEELKASDVPSACQAICGPMVTLTNTCDVDPESGRMHRRLRRESDREGAAKDESDEVVEAQCICNNTSFNVRNVAALCAACISQNGKKTDDMDKIMSQCGFASMTFTPEATTAVAGIVVKATKPAFTPSGSSKPTGSGSGSALASSTGKSAGKMSFDPRSARLGHAAAGVVVISLLAF